MTPLPLVRIPTPNFFIRAAQSACSDMHIGHLLVEGSHLTPHGLLC